LYREWALGTHFSFLMEKVVFLMEKVVLARRREEEEDW